MRRLERWGRLWATWCPRPLSPRICLFWTPHINGIIRSLRLCLFHSQLSWDSFMWQCILVFWSSVWLSSIPLCGSFPFLPTRQLMDTGVVSSFGCHGECRCEHWCASLCGWVFVSFALIDSGTGIKALPCLLLWAPFTGLLGRRLLYSQSPCVSTGPAPHSCPIPAVKEPKNLSNRHNQKTNAILTDPQSY